MFASRAKLLTTRLESKLWHPPVALVSVYHHTFTGLKKPVSLKNGFDKAVKLVHFITSAPLSSALFHICVMEREEHTQRLCCVRKCVVVWREGTCVIVWGWTQQASFHATSFVLESTTDRPDGLWFFRLGWLADIFSKMNGANLSLQGKQLTVFVTKDKIWTFKWKSEFWKACFCHHGLDSFPILKGFLCLPLNPLWSIEIIKPLFQKILMSRVPAACLDC